jgi:multidrug efflux pump subunit AcrA (membrane-fusion protein)
MTAVVLPLYAPDETAEGLEVTDVDPFNGHGKIVGVMVLEYFAGRAPLSVGPAMRLVASEATLSLRNALEHKQVFGLGLWKSVGGFVQSSRMPWAITAVLIATMLLIVSMLYQVEHHVIANGSLEPTARREIFATVDGIVKKLHVEDGQKVKAGDLLLELENADLQNQAESLAGQIQTASQRLASIQAVRLSNHADESQSNRMALEQRQLESELANLRAQQTIVQAQQKELLIKSPIDGAVIGWQLKRRLTDRPVSRGNLLISVADHDGPWSLRLSISDRDAGPMLASVQSKRELAVQFAVATQPEASFAATLQSVATAVRMDEAGQHVIDATANVVIRAGRQATTEIPRPDFALASSDDMQSDELDRFEPSDMRVGTDVTAKIACGKRSLLRSWFSDVFDFVHRNLLFYF